MCFFVLQFMVTVHVQMQKQYLKYIKKNSCDFIFVKDYNYIYIYFVYV